jgi:eukaryotic-like serine/threonine-protein kinase
MDTTLSAPLGQLLDGRYLVESQIARGGMATVYHAKDVRLERAVAIKIAHPELARDHDFVSRFIGEARAVASLSSPNVVAVFDQGSTGDLHYIAMEYVPGPTLRDLLVARGRLNPREALDIIERVLAGLAAAHNAGIIHRDVKPENVLLGNGTSVKVADFGLARAAASVSNTRTGLLIGTAAYLAPEQVASNSSDERTDVYAAGIMLFEMLTGVQPHTGESPLAVAYKHVNSVVPAPSSLVPELPSALDALVALGTSRDPDLRPRDARHYLKAIIEVRRGLPLPALARPDRPAGTDARASGSHRAPSIDADALPGEAGAADGLAPRGLANGGVADDGVAGGGGAMAGNGVAAGESAATGPLGRTSQFEAVGYQGTATSRHAAVNHTMIVPAMDADQFGGGSYRGRRGAGPPRRYQEPRLQRWLFSRRILVVLAVIVVGVAAWWLASGQYFSVPSVAGMSVGAARGELTGAGLVVVSGGARHSDSVPRGDVISTDPAAGASIRHGGTITVIRSLGPIMKIVPPVTGQPVAVADHNLKLAGLIPASATTQTSASIPAGIVIATNPVAGTSWPRHKPVQVVVSAGPPLPDFVGGPLTQAQAAAAAGGYSINPTASTDTSQPAGTIVQQSPPAGTPITAGEVVTVYVSPGPQMVNVPDVTGLSADQATQQLTAAGFNVTENDLTPGHKVISYSPQGQAPQGSTITIVVGFF